MTDSPLRLTTDFPPVDRQTWREVVDRDLKGVPFEKRLVTRLYENLSVPPLYLDEDWPAQGDPSGLPGQPPGTRGFAALPPAQGWTAMQRFAHPDPTVVAKEAAQELLRGVDAILLDVAVPDTAGAVTDSDGVVVGCLADLAAALDGIALDEVPIALSAGRAGYAAACALVALWQERGVPSTLARAAFNLDPIATMASGSLGKDEITGQLSTLGQLARFAAEELPNVTSVMVSSAPYNDAGATAVQELAAVLATGIAYLRAMEAAGLEPTQAHSQIVVQLPVGCDQFLEIAKLRALRCLWNMVLEGCGVAPDARRVRLHATTAKRVLTQRDPWVNMLRATVGCFSAAVAGADIISVEPFDAAIGAPDKLGRRLARNTQVVLKEESHLARVADPSGGCWYVEKLTQQLAEAAWKEFQSIEQRGGIVAVLNDGSLRESIEAVRQQRATDIARRKAPITGVSEFPSVKQPPVERQRPDTAAIIAKSQERAAKSASPDLSSKLVALRAATDGASIHAAVAALRSGAALSALASTRGAASAPSSALAPWRLASDFEALRDASDEHLRKTGKRPQVFLANLGPVAHHTARAMFTQNFFEAGGFEVLANTGFADATSAAAAWRQASAPLAVICSSDTLYESMVKDVAPALKNAGVSTLLLAGRAGEQEKAYRDAGVDDFIFIGCNVIDTLKTLLRAQGALS